MIEWRRSNADKADIKANKSKMKADKLANKRKHSEGGGGGNSKTDSGEDGGQQLRRRQRNL